MKNRYEIDGDTTIIFIKHHDKIFRCLIDTSDLEKINSFPNFWRVVRRKYHKTWYVVGNTPRKEGKTTIQLHRFLLDTPFDMVVDHKNYNGLDNRRDNLEICTHQENMQNRKGANIGNQSGVRGVTLHPINRNWVARIGVNGKVKHLGVFNTVEEAESVVEDARLKYMPYLEKVSDI